MITNSVFTWSQCFSRAAWRTCASIAVGLVALAAVAPATSASAQSKSPSIGSPGGVAGQAPTQTVVDLICNGSECRGDAPTAGPGQRLAIEFVSCFINTEVVDDLLAVTAQVIHKEAGVAGHFLAPTSFHPTGRVFFVSQPIVLTVPPEHFLRLTVQSKGGAIITAQCGVSGRA
jgi:hypothetical protein